MRKKWGIICAILVICVISVCNIWKKPKIVSCVTTMDTTYITVLMGEIWLLDKEIAVQEIIEMCQKNEFTDIKFSNHCDIYYITIYRNTYQLNIGKEWIFVKYNLKENNMKIL